MEYTDRYIGWTYSTEIAAKEARNLATKFYLGTEPTDDTTQWWCNYQLYQSPVDITSFYYIIYDESLPVVLGTASEFYMTYIFP